MADTIKREFDGNEGKMIPISEAEQWIKNYQDKNPDALRGLFFGEKLLLEMLSEPKVVGIRVYYGLKDNGDPTLVLCGVDKHMKDVKRREKKIPVEMMSESLKKKTLAPIEAGMSVEANVINRTNGGGEDDTGFGNEGRPCPSYC